MQRTQVGQVIGADAYEAAISLGRQINRNFQSPVRTWSELDHQRMLELMFEGCSRRDLQALAVEIKSQDAAAFPLGESMAKPSGAANDIERHTAAMAAEPAPTEPAESSPAESKHLGRLGPPSHEPRRRRERMHQSTPDPAPDQAPQSSAARWLELLEQAAVMRNNWQPVERADLGYLGAMHSWGLIEFFDFPECHSWFVEDGADPYTEPAAGVHVDRGGRHWRMTPKGQAWLQDALRRREQLVLERQAAQAAVDAAAALGAVGLRGDASATQPAGMPQTPEEAAAGGQATEQAQQHTQQAAATAQEAWEALTDRMRKSLLALFELGALDVDHRRTAAEIAEKAVGRHAAKDGLVHVLADLVQRGLVKSQLGRRGGYWLTRAGRQLVAGRLPL